MMKYVDLTPFRSFIYRELEVSRTLTKECRNEEMRNIKICLSDSILEFWISGVGGVKSRDSSS
jgi:hypothetical protein